MSVGYWQQLERGRLTPAAGFTLRKEARDQELFIQVDRFDWIVGLLSLVFFLTVNLAGFASVLSAVSTMTTLMFALFMVVVGMLVAVPVGIVAVRLAEALSQRLSPERHALGIGYKSLRAAGQTIPLEDICALQLERQPLYSTIYATTRQGRVPLLRGSHCNIAPISTLLQEHLRNHHAHAPYQPGAPSRLPAALQAVLRRVP